MGDKLDYQNRRSLLLRLLDYGNATKQNLVQWTGLSNTTVSDTINGMLKIGFVHTEGRQQSIGGRRSVIYSINADYGQFAGVEMGEQAVQMVLSDARGRRIRQLRVPRQEGELPITLLYRAVDLLLEQPEAANVLAMGIGVDGAIDYPSQTVLKSDRLGWQNVPLKEIVERRIYLPVFIDSAINGQVSLRKYTEGEKCPASFLALSEGSPGKAAVCLDGRICRGRDNLCGSAQSFSALVGHAASMADMLAVDKIWVACLDDVRTKEVKRTFRFDGPVQTALYVADPSELAWGMALEAETKWFGTVYFCTENPMFSPL